MIKKVLSFISFKYRRLVKSEIQIARENGVIIGENCRLLGATFGSEPWMVSVGNNVTLTSGVKILTHDGSTWLIRDEKGRRYLFRKTSIGNNVFVGINSIILPGVIIEDNVIIAAGTVVVKSIPTGSIVGGNPAKIIGKFEDYKKKMIETAVSDEDMDFTLSYRERIEKIIDSESKPFLSV